MRKVRVWLDPVIRDSNPVAYVVKVTRAVLLKGSEFADIKMDFVVISVFASAMLSLAVLSYRKRV